jgi:Ca2+-binding RTX toxin-like protein
MVRDTIIDLGGGTKVLDGGAGSDYLEGGINNDFLQGRYGSRHSIWRLD